MARHQFHQRAAWRGPAYAAGAKSGSSTDGGLDTAVSRKSRNSKVPTASCFINFGRIWDRNDSEHLRLSSQVSRTLGNVVKDKPNKGRVAVKTHHPLWAIRATARHGQLEPEPVQG